MVAAARAPAERRMLLHYIPWSLYVVMRDTLDQNGGLRVQLTYLEGDLEILYPVSAEHEVPKKQISRMFELFCLERNIRLYAKGAMTYREEEKKRGLEADESYCRDTMKRFPDLAIEVIVTSPLLDKLEVYRGLGVPEVWVYRNERFGVFILRGDNYEPVIRSEVFPEVDLALIERCLAISDQHDAIIAYRDAIRQMK